jgi:hypothetical protein
LDPVTGIREYEYKGGYWECRDKNDFGEIFDLY